MHKELIVLDERSSIAFYNEGFIDFLPYTLFSTIWPFCLNFNYPYIIQNETLA